MDCTVPSGVVDDLMDAWGQLADQTYDIFGVECDLIYSERKEISPSSSDDDVPQINSINSRRRNSPDEYKSGEDELVEEEDSEKIRVKIYWSPKDRYKIYGFSSAPDDQVMILCKLEDSVKINNAIGLRYTDKEGSTYYMTQTTKVIPYGFQKNKYGTSLWKYSK